MTTLRILLPVLIALLLSACVPYYYGIREDVWVTMSEPERLAAIDAYKERQLAIQRANEARAEQHRLELERMREAREDEEARHRARIEAFYQMQHNYGDMVRVRLQGGTMRINGHSRAYRPVVFTITDGEVRTITIYATNGDIVDLQVAYIDGRLYFDGSPTTQNSRTARLSLNVDWGLGHVYAGVSTRNVVSLANVEIYIEIVDTRYYDLRRVQLPAIVVHRDARQERFDQRRFDAMRPLRPNWPDRRDQQYDRRDQRLDRRETGLEQREQQLDRYQQQLNQREQVMDRDQRQLDRQQQQVDKDQRQLERQQQQVDNNQRQLERQQQQLDRQQQQRDRQAQKQQEPDSRYSRPDYRQERPAAPVATPQPEKTVKSRPESTPAAQKPAPAAPATPAKKQTLYDKRKAAQAKEVTKKEKKESGKKDETSSEEESDTVEEGKELKSTKEQNTLKRLGR